MEASRKVTPFRPPTGGLPFAKKEPLGSDGTAFYMVGAETRISEFDHGKEEWVFRIVLAQDGRTAVSRGNDAQGQLRQPRAYKRGEELLLTFGRNDVRDKIARDVVAKAPVGPLRLVWVDRGSKTESFWGFDSVTLSSTDAETDDLPLFDYHGEPIATAGAPKQLPAATSESGGSAEDFTDFPGGQPDGRPFDN